MLLRQGTRSIEDYVVDFLELAHLTHSDEICLMIFFRGGLSEPLSSIMPLHDPNWTLEKYIDTALQLSGSPFKMGATEELAESAPEAAPSQELAESAPEAAPSQELAESAPEAAPSQELTGSAPEAAPSRSSQGPLQRPLRPRSSQGPLQSPLCPRSSQGPLQSPLRPRSSQGSLQSPLCPRSSQGSLQRPLRYGSSQRPSTSRMPLDVRASRVPPRGSGVHQELSWGELPAIAHWDPGPTMAHGVPWFIMAARGPGSTTAA